MLLEGAERLSVPDSDALHVHPAVTARLLAKSPQLQSLATIIRLHHGRGADEELVNEAADNTKRAAQILRVSSDYDLQTTQGILPHIALARLSKQRDYYEPSIVAALADLLQCSESQQSISLYLRDICPGMTLEQGAVTTDGRPLMKAGTEVTEQLLNRLRMFANNVGVMEPILVSAPAGSLATPSGNLRRPHINSSAVLAT